MSGIWDVSLSRRRVLLGGAGIVGLGAAAGTWLGLRPDDTPASGRVLASSDAVARAEQARRAGGSGRTVPAALTAKETEIDLGGRVVRTWAYDDKIPGPLVRCNVGDVLEVEVRNSLAEPTTLHWHGLRLRNDMDGVPHLTQAPVGPGESMRYAFIAPDPGTYWLHPHVGLQRERGLFCPLIVDDPREPGDYDTEFIVVLDDWIDGIGASPEDVLAKLRAGGMDSRYVAPVRAGRITGETRAWQYHVPFELAQPPAGIAPASAASRLASAVDFPFYLLNGRLPSAPRIFGARPGQRARVRVINAAGASVFRLALGGHRLTVTHTDGFPVQPVTVDTLQIASGERYDLLVTLGDGVFPLVAVGEGKGAQALGVVRTADGPLPAPDAAPDELAGRLLALADLKATSAVDLGQAEPDTAHTVYLTGDMTAWEWRINAETYRAKRPFDGITPLQVRQGQRVRLEMLNQTPMYHPMHLHGHTFAVRAISDTSRIVTTDLPNGTRKDTVMVPPGERMVVDVDADNPGQWLLHCHNAYHLASGMATVMSYNTGNSR